MMGFLNLSVSNIYCVFIWIEGVLKLFFLGKLNDIILFISGCINGV